MVRSKRADFDIKDEELFWDVEGSSALAAWGDPAVEPAPQPDPASTVKSRPAAARHTHRPPSRAIALLGVVGALLAPVVAMAAIGSGASDQPVAQHAAPESTASSPGAQGRSTVLAPPAGASSREKIARRRAPDEGRANRRRARRKHAARRVHARRKRNPRTHAAKPTSRTHAAKPAPRRSTPAPVVSPPATTAPPAPTAPPAASAPRPATNDPSAVDREFGP